MGNRSIKIKHPLINKKIPKNAPDFVLEFARLIKNKHGTLYGQRKKIFLSDDVYVVEDISKVEFIRRQRIHKRLSDIKCNVATYKDMYWNNGTFFGKMKRYDMDLFDYLKDEQVCLPTLLRTLIPCLRAIHANGIYLQDIKPENIFLDIYPTHTQFYFADVDYAFVDHDFPLFVDRRPWMRTKDFSPELGKPRERLEAIRNDMYAMAVMVGRIETFYNNGEMYNIFTKHKGRILDREFDDRWKLNKEYVYAERCANFIMTGLHYEHVVLKFLYTLEATNYNSV